MDKIRREIFFAALALFGAVWAVWFQTGGFEYIRLDDNLFVFEYPAVAGGLTAEGIRGVFSNFTQGGIWMPLTSITYMVDITLWGATPKAHHLSSVAWHSINAMLVFSLFLRLAKSWEKKRRNGRSHAAFSCMLAALFWAIHPLRNESVAWIASRKDLVFTFFTLLGLHAWLARSFMMRICGAICCLLSCLSKPTAMVFPFVALIVELLDGSPDESFTIRLKHTRWRHYAPLVLMSIATGLIAVYSQTHVTGIDVDVRGLNEGYGSFLWRCLNAVVAIGLYVAQTAVPVGIHVMYRSVVNGAPHGMWIGLSVVFTAVILLYAYARKRKGMDFLLPVLAAVWFIVAVGPTLGVAGGFGDQARADRFLYLPSVAFSLLIAWSLVKLRLNRGWQIACVLLVAVYGIAAWWNAKTYATD